MGGPLIETQGLSCPLLTLNPNDWSEVKLQTPGPVTALRIGYSAQSILYLRGRLEASWKARERRQRRRRSCPRHSQAAFFGGGDAARPRLLHRASWGWQVRTAERAAMETGEQQLPTEGRLSL